jgi:hypothetical protein
VFPGRIVKARGAPTDVVLDAEPSTWERGARIKLNGMQVAGFELAEKLTQSQIHKAFAVKEMYVPHAEVCEAAQKKTGAKKKDGTHA